MYDLFEQMNEREKLEKADRNGERGKYRRVAGKTVFVRSKDQKCVKGPNDLRGKKMVMKGETTTEGFVDDLGSPSAEVQLTENKDSKKKKKSMPVIKSVGDRVEALINSLTELTDRANSENG